MPVHPSDALRMPCLTKSLSGVGYSIEVLSQELQALHAMDHRKLTLAWWMQHCLPVALHNTSVSLVKKIGKVMKEEPEAHLAG